MNIGVHKQLHKQVGGCTPCFSVSFKTVAANLLLPWASVLEMYMYSNEKICPTLDILADICTYTYVHTLFSKFRASAHSNTIWSVFFPSTRAENAKNLRDFLVLQSVNGKIHSL